ncbi:MAG: SCO1664 family protein [Actinomycetota bacterium]
MPPAADDLLDLLSGGEIEVLGLLPYSSNYTFLAKVGEGDDAMHAVYKPRRGERPLWDFPQGSLAAREVAAFLVSAASGWELVPPTVLRGDAPLGEGSLQLFVHHDPDRHFFVMQDERRYDFRVFAAFDAVINNADRKGGHVIEDADGRLWAVDHGVTFHVEPKLRTVIWDYAEQELGAAARGGLEKLSESFENDDGLASELEGLLAPEEIEATRARVASLLELGRFPVPETDRPLPWPLI